MQIYVGDQAKKFQVIQKFLVTYSVMIFYKVT